MLVMMTMRDKEVKLGTMTMKTVVKIMMNSCRVADLITIMINFDQQKHCMEKIFSGKSFC